MADYALEPGRRTSDPPAMVLLREPPANHGGWGFHVLRINGQVEWLSISKPGGN
jgi:hypothetical protein